MIEVKVKRQPTLEIVISGHAYSGDPGHDLVCAAVSAIVFGSLNAFDAYKAQATSEKIQEGYVHCKFQVQDDTLTTMFNMMLIQLNTIALAHPKNITITNKEV